MSTIAPLLEIMQRLRDPDTGCRWDIAQDFKTIAPYTIEEAYEVVDAIDRKDMVSLCGELGDLLFQVVFHAQIASEQGSFMFEDVIESVCDKMKRRHPHIFDKLNINEYDWERLKSKERKDAGQSSAMDGVAITLPALMRAQKLQIRAHQTGFDWEDREDCIAKLEEEVAELRCAQSDITKHEEAGDLLFAAVNVVRHFGIDAETALKDGNRKFETRFRAMETLAKEPFSILSITEKEALWDYVKSAE